MINKTIAIYVFFDDFLKKIEYKEPENRKVSDSEIITATIAAAVYFGGHIEKAICFVKSTGLCPNMLSKSRFNRRLHAIYDLIFNLFFYLAEIAKRLNINSKYVIDSFPIPICENIRIRRSKIVKGECYRGYKASMRKYFYGFTIQVIATVDRIPVEFAITPGHMHDSEGMKHCFFNLPPKSTVYGDSGYTDYTFEDEIFQIEEIKLMIARKSNSKRKHEPWISFIIDKNRKSVETMFSEITSWFPKRIHAVTAIGFIIKIAFFMIAFTFNKLID